MMEIKKEIVSLILIFMLFFGINNVKAEYANLTCTASDNLLNYVWKVTADGKGNAKVDFSYTKKESTGSLNPVVENNLVANDFYDKDKNKGKCPSKVYSVPYLIAQGRNTGYKLYIEKKNNSSTLNITENNNNGSWINASEKTRTCSYSLPLNVGTGTVSVVILRNSSGLTYTVSDGYKMSDSTNLDPESLDYDTSKNCPSLHGSCGSDGDNKYCYLTTEESAIFNENNALIAKETKKKTTSDTKYKNFYDANTKYYKCGKLERIPKGLPKFTNILYKLVKVIVPIILIVMGMIDFLKAVLASDENQMDTNPKNFMRRIGVAVLIYFVMTSVQLLVKVIGGNDQKSISACFNCFINSEKKCTAYDYKFETGD